MQKHLSLLADVRGCMTRFDPLTPQIVADQSEDGLTYEDLDAAAEDQYQLYGRTFVVRGISLVVRDAVIGECLQFIPPNKRAVLLLSFFGELSDSEIAAFLRISKATVTYRKKDGIRRLRAMMEAMEHEK